jgi:hypothetical protein
MATGAVAAHAIAEALDLLPSTVQRAARILREADRAFWPESGKGGGRRAAHVHASHLINLVLAISTADPITQAPTLVPFWRSFVPRVPPSPLASDFELDEPSNPLPDCIRCWFRSINASLPEDPSAPVPILPGATLGEALDNLLRWIGSPAGRAVRSFFDGHIFSVSFTWEQSKEPALYPCVVVSYLAQSGLAQSGSDHWIRTAYDPADLALSFYAEKYDEGPQRIGRTARVPFDVFRALSDICSDVAERTSPEAGKSTERRDTAGKTLASAGQRQLRIPIDSAVLEHG